MCGHEEDGAGTGTYDELELADRRRREADEYNGWRNRETWCVHLWLAAEPTWANAARVAVDAENQLRAQERIRDLTELAAGARHPSGLGDELLAAALARVDWPAIVAAFEEV
jgi:hypothetical protein